MFWKTEIFLGVGGTDSNAFMAFPIPAIGPLNSFDSQKEEEKRAEATHGSTFPSLFFSLLLPSQRYPSFLGGTSRWPLRGTRWVSGRSHKFEISLWFKLQQAVSSHSGLGAAEWKENAEKQGPTAPAVGNSYLQPVLDATDDAWR